MNVPTGLASRTLITFLCASLGPDSLLSPPAGVDDSPGGEFLTVLRSPVDPAPTGVLRPLEGVELRLFREVLWLPDLILPPESGGVDFVLLKLNLVPLPRGAVSFSELMDLFDELRLPRPYPDNEGVWPAEATPTLPELAVESLLRVVVVVVECILATDLISGE